MNDSIKYHPPLVFVYGTTVVRVHRPILTDAERAERMERIKEAAANLLYEAEKVHETKLHSNKGRKTK